MSATNDQKNELIDKIGICASSLCLVHCIFTTLLILGIPFFNIPFIDHHLVHEIFAVIVVSMVLVAVYPHCRKHGHTDIIVIALSGILFILSGVFFHSLPEAIAHTLTSVGSVLLITAHYKNIKVRHGKCRH